MSGFIAKLILIVFVHFFSYFNCILISAHGESGNSIIKACSFFLTEPFFVLVIYTLINWILIYVILKVKPLKENLMNRTLVIIGILCTIVLFCIHIYVYMNFWTQDGFGLFVFKDRWKGILF